MYKSLTEVKRANAAADQHWFSKDTMSFFESRVLDPLYYGRYFVTSERGPYADAEHFYTVREALPNGHIDTVGEFQAYSTAQEATQAIHELARVTA